MKIHVAGSEVEPVSFLLMVVNVWLAMTLISAALVAYVLVLIGIALVSLPMALLRKARG